MTNDDDYGFESNAVVVKKNEQCKGNGLQSMDVCTFGEEMIKKHGYVQGCVPSREFTCERAKRGKERVG